MLFLFQFVIVEMFFVFDLRGNTFRKGFIVILSNERIPFVAVDPLKSTKLRIRFLRKKVTSHVAAAEKLLEVSQITN